MYTCEEHGRGCVVVYDTGRCPFCNTIAEVERAQASEVSLQRRIAALEKERDEAVNEQDILVDEVADLKDQITELENG